MQLKTVTLPTSLVDVQIPGEELRQLLKKLPYISNAEFYEDPEAYTRFIGHEIEINANIGRLIAHRRLSSQNLKTINAFETCAGTGSSIRDLHLDHPNINCKAIEIAPRLVDRGREINPHIEFVNADILKWVPDTNEKIDLVLNSAAAIAYFSPEELHVHFKNFTSRLADNGAYIFDIGFFATLAPANLRMCMRFDGYRSQPNRVHWLSNVGYDFKTDFHFIGYSVWDTSSDVAVLLEACVHKNRAHRFSEIEYMINSIEETEKLGLQIRLWKVNKNADTWYSHPTLDCCTFEEVTDEICMDPKDTRFLIEIFRGNAKYNLAGESLPIQDTN